MPKFEVGKSYRWADPGPDPITVLHRTEKTITVTNGVNTWRMLVRTDEHGEYVRDSSMGRNTYNMFTSRAIWYEPTWTASHHICY